MVRVDISGCTHTPTKIGLLPKEEINNDCQTSYTEERKYQKTTMKMKLKSRRPEPINIQHKINQCRTCLFSQCTCCCCCCVLVSIYYGFNKINKHLTDQAYYHSTKFHSQEEVLYSFTLNRGTTNYIKYCGIHILPKLYQQSKQEMKPGHRINLQRNY